MRKFLTVAACFVASLILILTYFQPIFYGYGNARELYLYENSSNALIVSADYNGRFNRADVKGESFTVDKENFDVFAFFARFNGKIKFTESVDGNISYYGYSPKIKYRCGLNGYVINLHVCVRKNDVKIGSPIIFGSF